MSTMPCRWHRPARPRSHSGRATRMPPSPWTVSTIAAAGLSGPPPRLSSSCSSHRKSGIGPPRAWSNGIGVAWVSGTPAPAAVERAAGDRERAQRHAVEGAGEGDHVGAAGHLAGELQRRLDGVGAAGAGELHPVVQFPGLQDELAESGQKVALGGRVHVQRVDDPVAGQVVQQDLFERRVVVAVVERAGAGEEIQVGAAVLVIEPASCRPVEHRRPGAAVAADGGLTRGEDSQCVCHILFEGRLWTRAGERGADRRAEG